MVNVIVEKGKCSSAMPNSGSHEVLNTLPSAQPFYLFISSFLSHFVSYFIADKKEERGYKL